MQVCTRGSILNPEFPGWGFMLLFLLNSLSPPHATHRVLTQSSTPPHGLERAHHPRAAASTSRHLACTIP